MKPTTESEVLSDIRTRFSGVGYAVIPQVQSAVGEYGSRILDCLLVTLHPSKGQSLTGIEIKVSRSDWIRELKDPSKAKAFTDFCDYFYLAVSDASIVKTGELPDGWGLMVCDGEKVSIVIKANKMQPQAYSVQFLCGVLRAAAGWVAPRKDIDRELDLAHRKGYRKGRQEMQERVDALEAELRLWKENL